MNLKTLTGPSIHAALMEARRLFGDDVVLLESVPPQGNEPARITVMTDKPLAQSAAQPAAGALGQPAHAPLRATGAPAAVPAGPPAAAAQARTPQAQEVPQGFSRGFGYGAGGARPAAREALPVEESARAREAFSPDHGYAPAPPARGAGRAAAYGDGDPRTTVPVFSGDRLEEGRGRGRFFPAQDTAFASPTAGFASPNPLPAAQEPLEELLGTQFRILHERLNHLERCLGEGLIGATLRWASLPLFGNLLQQGMQPATVTRLFDSLAAKGYEPNAQDERLQWAVAQELRNMLDVAAPKRAAGTVLLIGPSGAGKTSLILKLASHPEFYGRRRSTVIVLLPEDQDEICYQNPVDVYRSRGIAVQTVGSPEEMQQALDRVQKFDQVLIDTPPMPIREAAARKMLLRLKRMVHPIMPLQVQLVLNTTRALEEFTPQYLHGLPLRPDTVALTHLDETVGWGRIAEWMMKLQLPVQFASTSGRVPEGVVAFSPTWFVEEMMQL